jgi:hypothetical protein
MTNSEIEKKLPIFRAVTIETCDHKEGLEVEGDFVYTPAWTNAKGLSLAASYEIWMRLADEDPFNYFIDPNTLEISLDGGETFTKILKEKYG